MAENWIMVIAEMRQFPKQGQESEITIIFGLDSLDQEIIDQKYEGLIQPCLADANDKR